jgi:hypothetical protein
MRGSGRRLSKNTVGPRKGPGSLCARRSSNRGNGVSVVCRTNTGADACVHMLRSPDERQDTHNGGHVRVAGVRIILPALIATPRSTSLSHRTPGSFNQPQSRAADRMWHHTRHGGSLSCFSDHDPGSPQRSITAIVECRIAPCTTDCPPNSLSTRLSSSGSRFEYWPAINHHL